MGVEVSQRPGQISVHKPNKTTTIDRMNVCIYACMDREESEVNTNLRSFVNTASVSAWSADCQLKWPLAETPCWRGVHAVWL